MEIQRFENDKMIKKEVKDRFVREMRDEYRLVKRHRRDKLVINHKEEQNSQKKIFIDQEKLKEEGTSYLESLAIKESSI